MPPAWALSLPPPPSPGDVRPFIRNIFKTHELVDKARNGTRDIASSSQLPLSAPSTAPSEEVAMEEADGNRGEQRATESEVITSKKQSVAAE